MKGFILGLAVGLCFTAAASYFSFNSQKTTIGGTTCIVVQTKMSQGIGVSCNWGR